MNLISMAVATAMLALASTAWPQTIRPVETSEAPLPGGHYSQAIVANGFVFVAGQLPIKPGTRNEIPAGIDAQTRQALSNVDAILRAASSSLDRVVSVTVYVTDIANWPEVNRVYAEVLGKHRPARVVAVSPQLHFGSLVEIQAVAVTEVRVTPTIR
jgi:2-iminobutanoate/2-iminopropanoate deaminase